jgi:hypothetical protein
MCLDLCSIPAACGTNAECAVTNHRKQCTCPSPLVGDPILGCKQSFLPCLTDLECTPGQTCYGRSCYSTCRSDSNCLNDERCSGGICKSICNSDAECSSNQICENRLCDIGCRSDNTCPNDESCINNECRSN